MSAAEKLQRLRELIQAKKLDAFVLFHVDAHQSEYLAPKDERIAFISGFTGSNALCVITKDQSLCWTDGRYYLACQKQLQEGWQMMKIEAGEKQYAEWIKDNLPEGAVIGVDEDQMPAESYKVRKEYFEKAGMQLVAAGSLVDEVWGDERPPMPQEKVWRLDEKYTGQNVQGKFKDIASKMGEGCNMMLVTTLDDIAWMLNLRGDDIQYNPLFFSYVLFHREGPKESETYSADLFIDQGKV